MTDLDPHSGQPVFTAGEPLDRAQAAMVMLHGRGATARDILSLTLELNFPGFAYLAPQAAGNSWYPYSFLVPMEKNEPWLASALSFIGKVFAELSEHGFPAERIILLGFSQGACLACEYVARNALCYGGLAGLSGGLIGPPGTPRNYAGSLDGTPVFLGCSDVDPHIPKERVEETARVLTDLGGEVTMRLYPQMGHTINQDELNAVRELMGRLPNL
jgi:phospholipase/carboxylesterase